MRGSAARAKGLILSPAPPQPSSQSRVGLGLGRRAFGTSAGRTSFGTPDSFIFAILPADNDAGECGPCEGINTQPGPAATQFPEPSGARSSITMLSLSCLSRAEGIAWAHEAHCLERQALER